MGFQLSQKRWILIQTDTHTYPYHNTSFWSRCYIHLCVSINILVDLFELTKLRFDADITSCKGYLLLRLGGRGQSTVQNLAIVWMSAYFRSTITYSIARQITHINRSVWCRFLGIVARQNNNMKHHEVNVLIVFACPTCQADQYTRYLKLVHGAPKQRLVFSLCVLCACQLRCLIDCLLPRN